MDNWCIHMWGVPLFLPMEKLEFENTGQEPNVFSSTRRKDKVVDIDLHQEEDASAEDEQLKAVEFSKNIVKTLEEKRKAHNKSLPKGRITLSQLKKVYRNGARIFSKIYQESYPEKTPGLWALARVSMYLRIRAGKIIETGDYKLDNINEFIDISESWTPLQEDFDQAHVDIKEKKLNYKYDDVDQLYLDEYQRIELEWD